MTDDQSNDNKEQNISPSKIDRPMAEKLAAEITLSESPGDVIKRWRITLKIQQKELAHKMGITQSVISDYESGRRKSPGIGMVKKIVETMLSMNQPVSETTPSKVIIDMKEFAQPVAIEKVCSVIGCEMANKADVKKVVAGYTIIDSDEAVSASGAELMRIYGKNPNRALIFAKVNSGKSPMIAIKVSGLKPGMVIMQGTEKVDEIAIRIADLLAIPLAMTKKAVEEISAELKKIN